MNPVVKGALQGAIPTLVLVGGTNLIVKKFRNSKPVLYWGSLAVATGVAIAIGQGRIPAPFMKAETFGAESKNCPECDSSNLGHEEMPYCYNCGEANEEDSCSNCDSENVGEEEMDYCYNCGSFGHWYDLEAEEFGAYDYEDDEKHFRISRKGDGETIAIIDVEVDGEYSHLNDALDAICDEPNRNVEQIHYGAESFEANAGGLKCNVCQNMVADTDGDKYFVCDTCANNEGMGAESFEADADTSSATPQYFYRWIGGQYSGNPIYYGYPDKENYENSLVHYVHPLYDEDYVAKVVAKLNLFHSRK